MARAPDKTAARRQERDVQGQGRMAVDQDSGFEMDAHRGTYSGFTALMYWGTIASFAVGALVVLIIAS